MTPIALAIYYPGWTPGRKFDEWDLVRNAQSRFAGHQISSGPELGFYDSANPTVLRRQIRQAQSAGLNGFLFCWYWDYGTIHLDTTLSVFREVVQEFEDFRYALIWVNRRPHHFLPLSKPAEETSVYEVFQDRKVGSSPPDLAAIAEHCFSGPFQDAAYLHIQDQPILAIFSVSELAASLGKRGLGYLRLAFDGIHVVGTAHAVEDWLSSSREFGFASITSYVLLPDWEGAQLQNYTSCAREVEMKWSVIRNLSGLPYSPSVCSGWDATSRAQWNLTPVPSHFPWFPVIIGNTRDAYANHIRCGLRFAQKNNSPLLLFASWNEWSEGHAIEPERDARFQKLDVVKTILKKTKEGGEYDSVR